jgi:hypothetical protein
VNPRFEVPKGRLAPALFLWVLCFITACGAPPPVDSRSQGTIQWEPINRWSGRGSRHLDSFPSEGALRIEWETKRSAGATGEGTLAIVMHSAISGRPLGPAAVHHRGEGKGIAYVSEDARVFFMNVSSTDVDWTIAVSERVR